MFRTILSVVIVIIGCLAFYGCGGSSNVTNRVSNAGSSAANAVSSAANTVSNAVSSATTSSPESFMKDAAQGGLAEVKMGELAAKNAKDPAVKQFGDMMVKEHGEANTELMALAKKKNMNVPTDLGQHQSTYDKLSKMTGADFDQAYVNAMVNDHESDLKEFQKQAENSSDADVKAFAAKGAQMVKKHLDAIKGIQAKMSK